MSDENPFSRRLRKQCTGTRAERKTARRLGATLTPASGALDGAPSDMVTEQWRIENKSTVNASVPLKLDWLLKIAQEAIEQDQTPALTLQFTLPSGQPISRGSWVLIPERVFKELLDKQE